ncbi:DUF624 domain-containing protein [Microbacterium sp. CIAB417]|uniref:DUF624 domain-containing protein n=1 Tax=Microbacterium sp. CIAB417 TaxID=2860287 RepID=UPI001FAB5E1A|nr:DUF624 domain-containing protein [Microbacterium sp. CIAB417]
MDRKQLRAARRADASGSGPTLEDRPPARFPGAKGAFALFGEVLWTGLLITVAGLPVVTLPAALAAGIRHLRRYVNAEESHARTFWHDWRRALLPGGLVVGAAAVVLAVVLVVDIRVAATGALPGGEAIALIGWAGLVAGAALVLVTASAWTPESGWRAAVGAAFRNAASDPVGAIYLAVAAVLVGVVTWMLIPLVLAGLGCAAFAAVAVPARPRRRA